MGARMAYLKEGTKQCIKIAMVCKDIRHEILPAYPLPFRPDVEIKIGRKAYEIS